MAAYPNDGHPGPIDAPKEFGDSIAGVWGEPSYGRTDVAGTLGESSPVSGTCDQGGECHHRGSRQQKRDGRYAAAP
ncbi:hypothetical protein AXZ95_2420 [Leifsonia sp. 115AMFTsu3.1]|nr:hypothetical protein AXZ95_2420 [Leifsonia sp. 115AMFTsu3.1]